MTRLRLNSIYTTLCHTLLKSAATMLLACSMLLSACHSTEHPLDQQQLTFSQDTLNFDTIFTEMGSITKQVKIYNYTPLTQTITSVRLQQGNYFQVNIDGISDLSRLANTTIPPRDSMFIFIKMFIPELSSPTPVTIEDNLLVQTTDQHSRATSTLHLLACGQDIETIDSLYISADTTLTGIKPRRVMRYIFVDSIATLTLDAGVSLILHDSAQIIIKGTLISQGTKDEPVVIRGDKLYHLFDAVPYDYVSGLYGGVFILQPQDKKQRHHQLTHTNIHGANYGLYCYSPDINNLSDIEIDACYIHNCSQYGLIIQNMNSTVTNTEISNAAYNCVYLAGGAHHFTFNTIANYFNNTNIRMHNIGRQYVASLFINNLSKSNSPTRPVFYNNIIAGRETDNLVIATPLPNHYQALFSHNYIMADTIDMPGFSNNVFGQTNDTVFTNTFYSRYEQEYYNFGLDSLSPARQIADTTHTLLYPTDRMGNLRTLPADAGCYQSNPTPDQTDPTP